MRAGARERKRPAPDRRQSLAGVPVLAADVSLAPGGGEEGGLTLVSRRPRGRGWLWRFAPPVIERRIELDARGAVVVGQIDGRRDVAAIAAAFAARFAVCRREAELATAAFLRSLAGRRMVAIVMREAEVEER